MFFAQHLTGLWILQHKKGPLGPFFNNGGEGGIRTLDTRLTYTPLAGERLQPLGHFSRFVDFVRQSTSAREYHNRDELRYLNVTNCRFIED